MLLHYDDATLKDLYFLDPQWLCDVLAHVVTIREINPFARTGNHKRSIKDSLMFNMLIHIFLSGIMRLEDLSLLFRNAQQLCGGGSGGSENSTPAAIGGVGGYVVSLLNKFEVALTWDSRTLLIPSLLPAAEEDRGPGEEVTVKVNKIYLSRES